jgi:hypothetical protein
LALEKEFRMALARLARCGIRGLTRVLLGGGLMFGSLALAQAQPPSVTKVLTYTPRQEVAITTPSGAEIANCKVDLVKGRVGSGWLLKDGAGKSVRKIYASNGTTPDTYSYYKDGVEVYREIVAPGAMTPTQFRWLNAGGSKWGIDIDRNGTIDTWKVISAEEVSQEALRALATKDLARLQALLMTDEDITALGLTPEMADAIRARRKNLKENFEATIAKLPKLTEKARWQHLATEAPQAIPAEEAGAKTDLIRHRQGTVLFESGGSNEWFQIGPIYLVGATWRLIDAPTTGTIVDPNTPNKGGMEMSNDPKLKSYVDELGKLDRTNPGTAGAAAVTHHLKRADLIEKIVALVKGEERDPWIRQVADSLSSAVQAGTLEKSSDKTAATRLTTLEDQIVKAMPGSNLAGYVCFRRLQAEYSVALSSDKPDFAKIQNDWLTKLTTFVRSYPSAEDTPDAMLQLGMVCEFLGKEVDAKNWYSHLVKNFPSKPQTEKAAGAARRLDLEGKVVRLAGPTLADPNTAYDIDQLQGKAVVIYYWASWNGSAAADFTKLKAILTANPKDVALVCINLDSTADEAKAFVTKNAVPGVQLYQAGGLESKLATQYGIMVLPSLFVVGKDGKCVSKSVQVSTVEDEIKKILTPRK